MGRIGVLFVTLCLLAAEAPVCAHTSPSEAAPDYKVTSRYSRAHTSWYIGFAVGAGVGWVHDDSIDDTGTDAGAAFSLIKVGWVARPWLLVGLEIASWFHFEGNLWWGSTWVMTGHYDVMTTYFPWAERGFYAKLGLGLGLLSIENYRVRLLGDTSDQTTRRGFDLRLGAGHEWQMAKSFNLGAELATGLVLFDGGRAHDLCAHLTFTWY